MTRCPAAARALLLAALSLTVLPAAAGCSLQQEPRPRWFTVSPSATSASPAGKQPVAPGGDLAAALVRAALVTEADLGEPWVPTRGARTWRDGLLKGTAEDPECRRLLDVLYTEELFGAPRGPRAQSALDDDETDAQLRYQVAVHRPADADRALDWLGSLPDRCGRFTATASGGVQQEVQVSELPLPSAGDARRALRVTLAGETEDGDLTYLTFDIAGVRVGEQAVTVTNAGLGEVYEEVTRHAVQVGAQRLADLGKSGRAQI
ncbi:hypothetical protein ACFY3O_11435 [Streptomyces sp. NPDC001046]|uniref:hypothetical protein n=1 Tax=unclassified Streptomyces TaxID=2593676 RepID=UPI0036CCDAB8